MAPPSGDRPPPLSQLSARPPARGGAVWSVGARVEARWRRGYVWYAGVVLSEASGRLTIGYDDGDIEEGVKPVHVRHLVDEEGVQGGESSADASRCSISDGDARDGWRRPHVRSDDVWTPPRPMGGGGEGDGEEGNEAVRLAGGPRRRVRQARVRSRGEAAHTPPTLGRAHPRFAPGTAVTIERLSTPSFLNGCSATLRRSFENQGEWWCDVAVELFQPLRATVPEANLQLANSFVPPLAPFARQESMFKGVARSWLRREVLEQRHRLRKQAALNGEGGPVMPPLMLQLQRGPSAENASAPRVHAGGEPSAEALAGSTEWVAATKDHITSSGGEDSERLPVPIIPLEGGDLWVARQPEDKEQLPARRVLVRRTLFMPRVERALEEIARWIREASEVRQPELRQDSICAAMPAQYHRPEPAREWQTEAGPIRIARRLTPTSRLGGLKGKRAHNDEKSAPVTEETEVIDIIESGDEEAPVQDPAVPVARNRALEFGCSDWMSTVRAYGLSLSDIGSADSASDFASVKIGTGGVVLPCEVIDLDDGRSNVKEASLDDVVMPCPVIDLDDESSDAGMEEGLSAKAHETCSPDPRQNDSDGAWWWHVQVPVHSGPDGVKAAIVEDAEAVLEMVAGVAEYWAEYEVLGPAPPGHGRENPAGGDAQTWLDRGGSVTNKRRRSGVGLLARPVEWICTLDAACEMGVGAPVDTSQRARAGVGNGPTGTTTESATKVAKVRDTGDHVDTRIAWVPSEVAEKGGNSVDGLESGASLWLPCEEVQVASQGHCDTSCKLGDKRAHLVEWLSETRVALVKARDVSSREESSMRACGAAGSCGAHCEGNVGARRKSVRHGSRGAPGGGGSEDAADDSWSTSVLDGRVTHNSDRRPDIESGPRQHLEGAPLTSTDMTSGCTVLRFEDFGRCWRSLEDSVPEDWLHTGGVSVLAGRRRLWLGGTRIGLDKPKPKRANDSMGTESRIPSNQARQTLLATDAVCDSCGARWPAGTITKNSFQCYRSKCRHKGETCLLRPTYRKVMVASAGFAH